MKAPERTTYIYRIVEKQRHLERVCPTINAAARFVAGELELNLASFRIEPHIDTEIPVGNRYVITSYLKWKSRDMQINEAMIEAANKPQHLRFSGFNFKFDECEKEEEPMITKN